MTTSLGRYIFVCLLVLNLTSASAQDLQSLVDAERAFAQTSADKSIRTAFLEYFDYHTIAFTKGQAVYGRKDWEKRPEGNGYLFWWPVYADIAASGDFGYTTGPAVYGPDKSTRETKGGIYYSSVWKKDDMGRWKVLADLGSSTYNPSENLTSFSTSSKPAVARNDISAEAKKVLSALDKSYNGELSELNESFDDAYFSSEARIHRPGIPPVVGEKAIAHFTDIGDFVFEHLQAHISSSNDMALTYGTVKNTTRKDGKTIITLASYMRVWKIEDGEWNIVLDVIN